MEVGIGLPNQVPGVDRRRLLDWARRAERRGFAGLGAGDRVAHASWEPLTTLAAAAAVTERVRLMTCVVLAPLRPTALLAKQAAAVDGLSGGRLVLGLAVGGRADDYAAAGADFRSRGAVFDRQLEQLQGDWPILVGGHVQASFERAARHAGWIMTAASPRSFAAASEKVRAAWGGTGRDGVPRLVALALFSLGARGEETARHYLGEYFAGESPEAYVERAAKTPAAACAARDSFDAAGCDELVFVPCSAEPEQVDLLADALRL